MTTHAPGAARAARHPRPRWLIPVTIAATVAIVLVLTGLVSVSAVLYAGLFGGMMLMHLGGHGGHGGGHGGHETHRAPGGTPDDGPDEPEAHDAPNRRGGCH